MSTELEEMIRVNGVEDDVPRSKISSPETLTTKNEASKFRWRVSPTSIELCSRFFAWDWHKAGSTIAEIFSSNGSPGTNFFNKGLFRTARLTKGCKQLLKKFSLVRVLTKPSYTDFKYFVRQSHISRRWQISCRVGTLSTQTLAKIYHYPQPNFSPPKLAS